MHYLVVVQQLQSREKTEQYVLNLLVRILFAVVGSERERFRIPRHELAPLTQIKHQNQFLIILHELMHHADP